MKKFSIFIGLVALILAILLIYSDHFTMVTLPGFMEKYEAQWISFKKGIVASRREKARADSLEASDSNNNTKAEIEPVLEEPPDTVNKVVSNKSNYIVADKKAICLLYPTKYSKVTGAVTFIETEEGIKVTAIIQGLKKGPHALHISEYGDCTSTDGLSAGNHFNPGNNKHGAPGDANHHLGDLGNIVADNNGIGRLEFIDSTLVLEGENSIIGRGMVVSQNADDFTSQNSEHGGPRLACGVIGVMK